MKIGACLISGECSRGRNRPEDAELSSKSDGNRDTSKRLILDKWRFTIAYNKPISDVSGLFCLGPMVKTQERWGASNRYPFTAFDGLSSVP